MTALRPTSTGSERPECHRYQSSTLEITWRERKVAEILALSVEEAHEFFTGEFDIMRSLDVRARGTGLDVIVANAAVGSFVPLAETTEEHVDQTFAVNVRGTLFTVQKALPLLNDGASIILVGSTAADRGMEAFGAYAASKAAVRSFARTWSTELKSRGIRVNVISPAWIETPGGTAAFGDEETARAMKEHVAATVPKGRMGQPDEAAAVVAFLASEQSSYVVGSNLYVDGGTNQV